MTITSWKTEEEFDASYQYRDGGIRANHGRPWTEQHLQVLRELSHGRAPLEKMCSDLGRSAAGVIPQLLKAGLIRVVDTLEGRKYYYKDPSPDGKFSPDTDNRSVIPTTSTKTESNIMNYTAPALQVKTKTLIHGVDATALTDDQIFELIAHKEAEITSLQNIKAVSQKLSARIAAIQADIKTLVDFVDARPCPESK